MFFRLLDGLIDLLHVHGLQRLLQHLFVKAILQNDNITHIGARCGTDELVTASIQSVDRDSEEIIDGWMVCIGEIKCFCNQYTVNLES